MSARLAVLALGIVEGFLLRTIIECVWWHQSIAAVLTVVAIGILVMVSLLVLDPPDWEP